VKKNYKILFAAEANILFVIKFDYLYWAKAPGIFACKARLSDGLRAARGIGHFVISKI